MTEQQPAIERRHYDNPPVIEAIVDIKVSTVVPPAFDTLARIVEGEEARYPSRNTISTGQIAIDLKSLSANTSQDLAGYRFTGASADVVVQARRDGFSFSKLPPYTDWEVWQPEARRLWNRYRDLVQPTNITRIAVRYVNRIVVPHGSFDPRDYFNCYPELPDTFGSISELVMRFEIPQVDPVGKLIFSYGILPRDRPDAMPILVDFDVFRETDLPNGDDALWVAIEELHRRENVFFESTITELTRELFRGASR